MPNLRKPLFLSIKWKAAFFFGTLLIIFNISLPALVYWNLQQNLDFSRDQIQQQFKQELIGELAETSIEMQLLVETLLLSNEPRSEQQQRKNIAQLLQNYRSALELDWRLSHAQHLDANAHHLSGWGGEIPADIKALVPSVITTEEAKTALNCSQKICQQFHIIPVLTQTKINSILLIAYDLSGALLEFNQETGADLAVVTRFPEGKKIAEDHHIPQWNMQIEALSSFDKNHLHLQNFAKSTALSNIKDNQIIRRYDSPIELHFIQPTDDAKLLFIIIDDIGQQQQDIMMITQRSILLSIVSLFLLAIALFFFVSTPLSRLTTISKALPSIAEQKYDIVKSLIRKKTRFHFVDELDQLEASIFKLTSQLEQLYNSVKTHTLELNSRSEELQQERDFNKSLIDTAQLVIITVDKDYNLTSFNSFAEKITGHIAEEMIHHPIALLFPKAQLSEVEDTFQQLIANSQNICQQESELIHIDGTIHTISWLHSSLNHPTDDSVILSIGLDITEKKHSDNQIIWLAEHDTLTELYNRRKFNAVFEQVLNNAQRFEHQGALLFLDLDQFKDINDSYGHKVGDVVLKQVAKTLLSMSRTTDTVARLGGDEFAIILPETDEQGACNFAGKISEQLALMDISFNNMNYKVTTSIGLVMFPLADLTIEELISNADLAMYQAKAQGKNTWHIFNTDDQTRAQLETRIFWKQLVETSIENHTMIFHYQPIMHIESQAINHYEVLVRIKNDAGDLKFPSSFIQIAEQTGLINKIDHYVLENSINKQAELDRQNIEVSLSINISAAAISDPLLLPLLENLLEQSDVNPQHLIFELTETAAVSDIVQARKFMESLHSFGCRFSLDDFGAGFSSFRYLRELPVDIIKIDGSFISSLVDNVDDQLFVKALIDVGKGMGKKTIAEFVENAETLELLKTLGVDYAQGYYIGKPEADFI